MFFIEGLVYHLFTLQQGENVELIEASCIMHKNYFWITLFICRNKACMFSSIFNRCYNIMLSAVLSTFAVKNDATSCIWQYCSARLRIWQSTLELKTLTLLFFFFFSCTILYGIQYRILLYISQQQQIASARIHPGFVLTVRSWIRKASSALWCSVSTSVWCEMFS